MTLYVVEADDWPGLHFKGDSLLAPVMIVPLWPGGQAVYLEAIVETAANDYYLSDEPLPQSEGVICGSGSLDRLPHAELLHEDERALETLHVELRHPSVRYVDIYGRITGGDWSEVNDLSLMLVHAGRAYYVSFPPGHAHPNRLLFRMEPADPDDPHAGRFLTAAPQVYEDLPEDVVAASGRPDNPTLLATVSSAPL